MTSTAHPPWRHLLLALAVVVVWGTNFVVIKLALAHLPPLLFATLRYLFALFPAGLVLYWVTNTLLSIAQQWNINRRIAAQAARKKS